MKRFLIVGLLLASQINYASTPQITHPVFDRQTLWFAAKYGVGMVVAAGGFALDQKDPEHKTGVNVLVLVGGSLMGNALMNYCNSDQAVRNPNRVIELVPLIQNDDQPRLGNDNNV